MSEWESDAAAQDGSADESSLWMLQVDPDLAGMFFAEALDHLGSIEATVLALESSPSDVKLLNDLFRPFHTIKGNAGALGITSLQAAAHTMEGLLDLVRSGKHVIGPAEIEVILKAVDVLTAMIGGLRLRVDGRRAPDTAADRLGLIAEVERIIAGGSASAPPPRPVTAAPAEPEPELSFAEFGPEPAPATEGHPGAAAPEARAGSVKVDSVRMDTVKIDTRKLDNLVDMVGELVIVQTMIHEDPTLRKACDERLGRNLNQLKRITTDLQRNAMAMRMVPVRQTFQKMLRLVRDVGKKSGKTVDLDVSGEETEIDRQMVEDISDPLMHMVRNGVDHGIEDAETRARAGKPARGRLKLSACHHGGSIVISLADDGGGLPTGKIRTLAIAQGLIGEGDVLSDNEIHEFIFRPGFSTADRITEISGRGVGMDVVRRNIEALRGKIEIHSVAGHGTTFIIKLPLTLAILDGLVLRAGGERFVIPTFAVAESLRPKPEQVHAVQGRPLMIQVRNSLLPMFSLAELIGVDEIPAPAHERTAVVIEDDGKRVALLVDDLLGRQEVVIKSLGVAFTGVRGTAGGAILGDGRVGLILDAAGLVELVGNPSACEA